MATDSDKIYYIRVSLDDNKFAAAIAETKEEAKQKYCTLWTENPGHPILIYEFDKANFFARIAHGWRITLILDEATIINPFDLL